jgi:hypothetical protein
MLTLAAQYFEHGAGFHAKASIFFLFHILLIAMSVYIYCRKLLHMLAFFFLVVLSLLEA